jgi:hypothetical protein
MDASVAYVPEVVRRRRAPLFTQRRGL